MKPLASWPAPDRRQLLGVFTDIDDTLTTEGVATGDALRGIAALHEAGLHVIPITGRPVGWSEPFARAWPVDGGPSPCLGQPTSKARRWRIWPTELTSSNYPLPPPSNRT